MLKPVELEQCAYHTSSRFSRVLAMLAGIGTALGFVHPGIYPELPVQKLGKVSTGEITAIFELAIIDNALCGPCPLRGICKPILNPNPDGSVSIFPNVPENHTVGEQPVVHLNPTHFYPVDPLPYAAWPLAV